MQIFGEWDSDKKTALALIVGSLAILIFWFFGRIGWVAVESNQTPFWIQIPRADQLTNCEQSPCRIKLPSGKSFQMHIGADGFITQEFSLEAVGIWRTQQLSVVLEPQATPEVMSRETFLQQQDTLAQRFTPPNTPTPKVIQISHDQTFAVTAKSRPNATDIFVIDEQLNQARLTSVPQSSSPELLTHLLRIQKNGVIIPTQRGLSFFNFYTRTKSQMYDLPPSRWTSISIKDEDHFIARTRDGIWERIDEGVVSELGQAINAALYDENHLWTVENQEIKRDNIKMFTLKEPLSDIQDIWMDGQFLMLMTGSEVVKVRVE